MRFILGTLLCAGLLVGCVSKNSGPNKSAAAKGAKISPLVPTLETIGKVVSVNTAVRFVVLEFPLNAMPALGQKLNVYHGGQKVGELKISGPQNENNTVADLTAGSAQTGDEVRAD
ncbi:MAG: hypothetical protein HY043_23235 [Verrucomicrobia bacterium]|nr:hypothetical protein [Verrucomicrobiota bacterium]